MLLPNYVVTNAHVVWPYREADVLFSDGAEYQGVPVQAWDMLKDVAVLGPLADLNIEPIPIAADGEASPIGSDVYLIGYPGEIEPTAQPAITRGILSKYREWEAGGQTYFQTDSTIVGGQSGGVLVSAQGEMLGISGFEVPEKFALVASITDLMPLLENLVAADTPASAENRMPPTVQGASAYTETLTFSLDTRVFVIDVPVTSTFTVELTSGIDAYGQVTDASGFPIVELDNTEFGIESGGGGGDMSEPPYYFVVGQRGYAPGEVIIKSGSALLPFPDEDGTQLKSGQTIIGNLDFPLDSDYFLIDLEEGAVVEVLADSMMIDPLIGISYRRSPEAFSLESGTDDNSGGGIMGWNAALTYEAPMKGTYVISVMDAMQTPDAFGGYYLTVRSEE